MAAFTTSEWELARQLYALLQPEDVVVADSAYGTNARFGVGTLNPGVKRCFVNIMPVTVIFDGARSWALVIILSIGNVLSGALNQ